MPRVQPNQSFVESSTLTENLKSSAWGTTLDAGSLGGDCLKKVDTVDLTTFDSEYISQEPAMKSKVMNLDLEMWQFDTVFRDKIKVAENKFPSETGNWRKWFAESLVWGYFCKLYFFAFCVSMIP